MEETMTGVSFPSTNTITVGVVQWNKTADSRYIETFLLASFLLERLSKNLARNTLIVGIAMVMVSAAKSMQFKKLNGQDYPCSKLRSKTIQLVQTRGFAMTRIPF